MSDPRVDAAISAALAFNWQKALEINNLILAECPEDVDCLNRIGKAHLELGDSKKALQFFHRVLRVNKYDQIALKNLTRCSQKASSGKQSKANNHQSPSLLPPIVSFLEEPGKTKVVALVNITSGKTLLSLNNADPIVLSARRHTIIASHPDGTYLGALPDDLGHRLLILIKGGNKYDGCIKSVRKNHLTIFIKERLRAKKFHNTPSFPTTSADYLSFIREDTSPEETTKALPARENVDEDDVTEEGDTSFRKAENIHQDEEPEET